MKKGKIVWIIILIISIIAFLVSGYFIYKHVFTDETKTDIGGRKAGSKVETKAPTDENGDVIPTEPPTEHRYKDMVAPLPEESSVDFAALYKTNKDIYSWIYIPNTNVDYAVAQSAPGISDAFYLNHDVYKNYKFAGTIYSEKQNKLDYSDPVTLLYGHNMLNGSMFATLHKFNDKKFFDKNKTMFIFTEDKIYTYLIYAAYQYDSRHILNSFDMSNPDSLKEYQDSTLLKRPYYCNIRKNITLDENDRIVTLSTCMNGGGSNVRYLVQGVLVNEQPAV